MSDPLDDPENIAAALKSSRIVAHQFSRKFGLRRGEEEDLRGELLLRVVQKRHLYDPAKATWPTWLDSLLGNAARNFGEARIALKRDSRRTVLMPSS